MGKKHISSALELFNRRHPEVSIAINITRHPFSFRGDGALDNDPGFLPVINSELPSSNQLQRLGDAAGIIFKIDRSPFYNPLDSQRALLWAARFGKQEELAEVLSRNHFERAMTSSRRSNIILAMKETVGLDEVAGEKFLNTEELVDFVKTSYRENVHLHGIKSIPLVVFNLPDYGIQGGPFRPTIDASKRGPWIKRGSNTPESFLISFEAMYSEVKKNLKN